MPTSPLIPLLLGAVCSSAPMLRAQSPAHGIPVRGAALYQRTFARETKVLLPDPTTLGNVDVGEVPHGAGAAALLHSDLDAKGRRVERAPTVLVALAPFVAFDLTTLGDKKLRLEVPELRPFGRLQLEGRITRGEDGVEQLRLQVRSSPVERGGNPPQAVMTAELQIDRRYDAERGIVDRFRSTLTGELSFPGRQQQGQIQRASFTLRDDWQLREVVGNREQSFQNRVSDAIRKGAANLKEILAGDYTARFDAAPDQSGQTRRSGELALILLTLLKAGESQHDPVVRKALDDLRARHIADTYSLGVALLTLEACYTPANERDDLLAGRLAAPHARQPTPADKAVIERWVEQLLQNRTEVDRDETTRWHYLPSPDFDNSCSQYGVLGLYAAHLCGVEVDRDVWIGAAKHFLRMQTPPTTKVRLALTSHRQLAENRSGSRTGSATEAAGWTYRTPDSPPTGSMTTAGIGSLSICDSVLAGRSRPGDVSGVKLRDAIKAGLAWLADNYDLRHNPGSPESWRLYYLYGLERACELNQIAHVQSRDWYFDGATLLLEEQGPNGRWGDEVETCFAILFLKKAALPVLTGKR